MLVEITHIEQAIVEYVSEAQFIYKPQENVAITFWSVYPKYQK